MNFNEATIKSLIGEVHAEREKLVPSCSDCEAPCGRNDDYDMSKVWDADEDIRSLKSLILFGIRGVAAYAYHADVLGYTDAKVNEFLAKALFAIGEDWGMDELLPIVLEVGEINFKCMEMLDKANTETYGNPTPVTVPLMVEKGPFIVITGHDLYDLKQLLEQTKNKGINVYTHELRYRLAEPAERICEPSGTDPVYHQLPDASESQLQRPRVYHRGRFLS